ALTSAQPIRCVKDTLPPRARLRWLLMTMRLSISSLTGTSRTLVAVGTVRLVSMFCAVRAGAPRRIFRSASSAAGWAAWGSAVLGSAVLGSAVLGSAVLGWAALGCAG